MAESLSELEFESDVSSIDGRIHDDNILKRRLESLQQENAVLKKEIDSFKSRVKFLTDQNDSLRRESVNIQVKAEQEEEFISNRLLKEITELKKEKESLAISLENEEEYLTNELNRKFNQLKQDRDMLEKTLAKEQEAQINKLMKRIKKLETDVTVKQDSLDKLRREKIELENALEQEQEALVNRLWKKMEKLEEEKRSLQEKLESVSAPISGSSSVQNLSVNHETNPSVNETGDSFFDRNQSNRSSLRNASIMAVNGSTVSLDKSQLSLADSTSEVSFGSVLLGSRAVTQMPMECEPGSAQFSTAHLSCNSGPFLSHSASVNDVPSSMRLTPLQNTIQGELHVSPNQSYLTQHNNTNPSTPNADQQPFARISAVSPVMNVPDSTQNLVAGGAKHSLKDSKSVSQYVQSLRQEVVRLRKIVYKSQADRGAVMEAFDAEEKSVAEENKRLRRMLQSEIERREALCRQLSESESSLEMEDERQFNEANRAHSTRFRTTSESGSSPPIPGGFNSAAITTHSFGPGHAYAMRINSIGSEDSPISCRECGQVIPLNLPMDSISSASSTQSRGSRSNTNNNRPKSSCTPSPVLLGPIENSISSNGIFAHPSGIITSLTPTTTRNSRSAFISQSTQDRGKIITHSSSGCVTPSDDELSSINDPGDFDDDADYEDERSVTPPLCPAKIV